MAFAFVLVFALVFSFFFRPSMFAFRTLAYAYSITERKFHKHRFILRQQIIWQQALHRYY